MVGTGSTSEAVAGGDSRERGRSKALAALCHDLMQCVSAALLLTQLPEDDVSLDEVRRRFSLIERTLQHAAALLETAGMEMAPRRWWLDLGALATECAHMADVARRVKVERELRDRPALVRGDPLLLHRALDNMIDNASRAAGETGLVVVRVGGDDDQTWVEVVDDGPGFGEIEHGTGQGLTVVSSAARACGGRLEISSGPGPGTTVRLAFPRLGDSAAPGQDSADPSLYSA
jgi:signal transduction histidine kinase